MRVFVSYRREDNPWVAGRLRDRLGEAYGDANVFFDVDDIPMGTDFRDVIRTTLEEVDVVLAVIGAGWNPQRLAQGADFVRAELLEAIRMHKRVVPVLVDDTPMPPADSLPSDLEEFAYLNAVRLRPDPDFTTDVGRLVSGLAPSTAVESAAPVPLVTPPPPESTSTRHRRSSTVLVVGLLLLVVIGLVVAGVALAGGGGSDDDVVSPPASVVLPPNSEVFQHSVDEIVHMLSDKGLETGSASSGCSNSTDPGLVREVTVGATLDDRIIYGKEGQEHLDQELRNHLAPGTAVTVWTPSARPCP